MLTQTRFRLSKKIPGFVEIKSNESTFRSNFRKSVSIPSMRTGRQFTLSGKFSSKAGAHKLKVGRNGGNMRIENIHDTGSGRLTRLTRLLRYTVATVQFFLKVGLNEDRWVSPSVLENGRKSIQLAWERPFRVSPLEQVDRTIPSEYKSRSFHCLNPCSSMLPSVRSFRWISFANTIINDRRLEERIVVGVCRADSCSSRCTRVCIGKIRTRILRLCETHDVFVGVVVAPPYPEEAKLDRTTIVKHTNNKQSFLCIYASCPRFYPKRVSNRIHRTA